LLSGEYQPFNIGGQHEGKRLGFGLWFIRQQEAHGEAVLVSAAGAYGRKAVGTGRRLPADSKRDLSPICYPLH
jgi:hypothetical protein